jgi:hypothetical protein
MMHINEKFAEEMQAVFEVVEEVDDLESMLSRFETKEAILNAILGASESEVMMRMYITSTDNEVARRTLLDAHCRLRRIIFQLRDLYSSRW